MNDLAVTSRQLPDNLEDLSKFVLVGREKLTAVRAELRAIQKIQIADGVHKQKLAEAQGIAEIVLDAEIKVGELTSKMEKAVNQYSAKDSGVHSKSKQLEEIGITEKQKQRYETLTKFPEIVEQAKEEARKNGDIISRSFVLGKIKQAEREKELEKQIEHIEKGNIEKPDGLYDVIAMDPPWNYGTRYDSSGRRVANPYPELSQEELLDVDIPAKDDCVLFLWTTHKFIWDAKALLDKWGFEYRSMLVWDKEKIGMGDLIRMQCEFCLIGIKGKPVFRDNHSIRDIIHEPRREHSRKPEQFYQLVNDLCVGKKLDYFSREKRRGWDCYGNDTEKF